MSNDLDELMSRDPTELSSADIDTIIAYHRAQRARKASGEKPIRPKSTTGGSSLLDLMSKRSAKPEVKLTRRV